MNKAKNRQPYTIRHTDKWYCVFNYCRIVCSIVSVLYYPQVILFDIPHVSSGDSWLYILIETVFALEIILGFFLQRQNEQGYPMNETFSQVRENYIK